jgi:hypothetical protein
VFLKYKGGKFIMAKNKKLQSLREEDLQGAAGGGIFTRRKKKARPAPTDSRPEDFLTCRQDIYASVGIRYTPGATEAEDRYFDLSFDNSLDKVSAQAVLDARLKKRSEES